MRHGCHCVCVCVGGGGGGGSPLSTPPLHTIFKSNIIAFFFLQKLVSNYLLLLASERGHQRNVIVSLSGVWYRVYVHCLWCFKSPSVHVHIFIIYIVLSDVSRFYESAECRGEFY